MAIVFNEEDSQDRDEKVAEIESRYGYLPSNPSGLRSQRSENDMTPSTMELTNEKIEEFRAKYIGDYLYEDDPPTDHTPLNQSYYNRIENENKGWRCISIKMFLKRLLVALILLGMIFFLIYAGYRIEKYIAQE